MKRITSFALILALFTSVFGVSAYAEEVSPGAEKFKDVPQDAWYYPYVDRLTKDSAIAGVSADTFMPDKDISWAEFVTLVMRTADGFRVDKPTAGHWGQDYMNWAYELNVVTPEETPTDKWDSPILRQDMAKVIARSLEIILKEKPVEDTASAIERISDWESVCTICKPYVAQAYAKGILAGFDGSDAFNGTETTSRGEAAYVILKLIDPAYRSLWYDSVPFSPAADITERGTMTISASERFIAKILENTAFYEEGGKYYVSCTYPNELPEGFEPFFSVGVEFTDGLYFMTKTHAIRESDFIPKTGSFKCEITGMTSLSDTSYVRMAVAIYAPNANTDSYQKYECKVTLKADYSAGKHTKLEQWMDYTIGSYKDTDFIYADIFKW
jgi:hypothetical protein